MRCLSFRSPASIVFLLAVCLSVVTLGAATKPAVQPLEMYEQWSGFNSGFSGQPAYQFIRDYETFKSFWARHKPDEFMPQIDLDKLQVFVWCPGPVLSGERLVEALRFYRSAEGLTLVVRTELHRDSGAWQAPFLIAFLQKTSGHVRIMRPGSKARREPPLMPLFHWQDMGLPAIYHPAAVSLQAPKRPEKAWRNPWELDIPNPIARPAWTKQPTATAVEPAVPVTETAEPKPAASASAAVSGTKPAGQTGTKSTSSTATTGTTTTTSSNDPTDIGNASGADPLQDPFNLDF
ncbi:MAG TPA: hypothetical protein PKO06_08760 [Candidatus Ozemobacteraceae bacterium]|nr:hypothetical protein [Candidatus Ozemobacteraceae bacterium]